MGFGDGYNIKSIPWVDPAPGTASMLVSDPTGTEWVVAAIEDTVATVHINLVSVISSSGNIQGNGAYGSEVTLKDNISLSSVTSSFKGNVTGTSSYAINANTASYIATASYAIESDKLDGYHASQFTTTSSFNSFTSSYNTGSFSGSFIGDGSQLINISGYPRLGNTILVDSVNGSDVTGTVNGSPFKTVDAAINYINSNSLTGVTVWMAPATYTLSSGITLPSGCSLRGLSTQTTKLVLTGSNPGGTVTMLTMGENTRVEDLSLTLTSTNATTNLVGILLPGTTGTTSKLRTAVLTVDNSSITASANTNVYGVWSSGSATVAPSDFSFNFTRGVTLNVFSNGGGNKRGVYADSTGVVTFRDTNVYVKAPSSATSAGSYVGVETTNSSASVQFRTTSIYGPSTSGSYTGSDILQTSPGTGFIDTGIQLGPGCDLVNKTAGGKPFTAYVTPTTIIYGLQGNVPNGTNYLWPGVQTSADTTEVYYRFQQKSILQGMSINSRVAPGNLHSYTITALKSTTGQVGSGIATAMSASITATEKSTTNYVSSVDFGIGEYLGVRITTANPGVAADLTIELDLF